MEVELAGVVEEGGRMVGGVWGEEGGGERSSHQIICSLSQSWT